MTLPVDAKLLAIDLDGTLLDDRKQVDPATADALARLNTRLPVVIASARPPRSVRHLYQRLRLDTLQINYNGALVWDEVHRRPVHHLPLPGGLVESVANFARQHCPAVAVSTEVLDRWHTDHFDPALTTETGKLFAPDVIAPLEQFIRLDSTKLLLLGEPSAMAELRTQLQQRFAGQVTVIQTDDHLLQITHAAAGKATALQWVAEHYRVDITCVLAIGDNDNDIGMLELAGKSVAMGNATAAVKAVSDWIAPDNNHAGVLAALRHFHLL